MGFVWLESLFANTASFALLPRDCFVQSTLVYRCNVCDTYTALALRDFEHASVYTIKGIWHMYVRQLHIDLHMYTTP